MISGLVAKGFVTRKDSSDDRREVKIHITPRGRAALEAALEATQSAMAQHLAGLTEQQREALASSLELLHSLFGPTVPSPAVTSPLADEPAAEEAVEVE